MRNTTRTPAWNNSWNGSAALNAPTHQRTGRAGEIGRLGLELLGAYQEDHTEAQPVVVAPEELRLTSWEILLPSETRPRVIDTKQLQLEPLT